MTNLNIEKKQIDLINESISVFKTCNHCIDLYKTGNLTFLEVEEFVDDRGKSCLYRLKQMCHELFRNTMRGGLQGEVLRHNGGLHLSRGHEAPGVHLSAGILQAPVHYLVDSAELTSAENKVIHEFDLLINKAEKRLAEGLKEVKTPAEGAGRPCKGPDKDLQGQLSAAPVHSRERKVFYRHLREEGLPGSPRGCLRAGPDDTHAEGGHKLPR